MTDRIEWIEHNGALAFRVTIPAARNDSHRFEATVDEIMAILPAGEPPPAGFRADEIEPYMHLVVKGDSCSHVCFGTPTDTGRDGYLHMCGVLDWEKHAALMRALYDLAFKVMGREPDDGEAWS